MENKVGFSFKPSWDDAPEWATHLFLSSSRFWIWTDAEPRWSEHRLGKRWLLKDHLSRHETASSNSESELMTSGEFYDSLESRPESIVERVRLSDLTRPDWPDLSSIRFVVNTEYDAADIIGCCLNEQLQWDLDAAAKHFKIDDIPQPTPGSAAGDDVAHGYYHEVDPAPVAEELDMEVEGYEELKRVLLLAFDQAARGKGKERHANDLPFHQQPIQTISDLIQSPGGLAYQIMKKTQEALSLPTIERQRRELLGAIVYTAALIIWLEKQPVVDEAVNSYEKMTKDLEGVTYRSALDSLTDFVKSMDIGFPQGEVPL